MCRWERSFITANFIHHVLEIGGTKSVQQNFLFVKIEYWYITEKISNLLEDYFANLIFCNPNNCAWISAQRSCIWKECFCQVVSNVTVLNTECKVYYKLWIIMTQSKSKSRTNCKVEICLLPYTAAEYLNM